MQNMLKKYDMDNAKVANIPFPTNGKLGLGDIDEAVDQKGTPFHIWICTSSLRF
jgi:hypothetical protein